MTIPSIYIQHIISHLYNTDDRCIVFKPDVEKSRIQVRTYSSICLTHSPVYLDERDGGGFACLFLSSDVIVIMDAGGDGSRIHPHQSAYSTNE